MIPHADDRIRSSADPQSTRRSIGNPRSPPWCPLGVSVCARLAGPRSGQGATAEWIRAGRTIRIQARRGVKSGSLEICPACLNPRAIHVGPEVAAVDAVASTRRLLGPSNNLDSRRDICAPRHPLYARSLRPWSVPGEGGLRAKPAAPRLCPLSCWRANARQSAERQSAETALLQRTEFTDQHPPAAFESAELFSLKLAGGG